MYVNYLYDANGKLCSASENTCFVDNKIGYQGFDDIYLTHDSSLEKEYIVDQIIRKIPISYHVVLHENEKSYISISDGSIEVSSFGNVISPAISAPITKEVVKKQLSRLGNTPFIAKSFHIEMDSNIFISVKELNEMRRTIILQFISARENQKVDFIEKSTCYDSTDYHEMDVFPKKTAIVYTEEQLQECLRIHFDRIYVVGRKLYDKYKTNSSVILYLERCAYDYHEIVSEKNYVQDLFSYQKGNYYGGYGLNVTNIYTAYYLRKLGLRSVSLSVELTDQETNDFMQMYYDKFGFCEFESLRYGRVENMIIRGNLLNIASKCNKYEIVDEKKRRFPVFYDGNKTHIYHCETFHRPLLKCVNLFDFYGEEASLIERIVKETI